MKNFNIKRFWYTFRWYVIENRNMLLLGTAGMALGIFLTEMFTIWMGSRYPDGPYLAHRTMIIAVSFCMLIIVIAQYAAFSSIFSLLKKRQKRIAFLTLPATNLERYLAVLIFTIVVWPICIFGAYVLGELLRMLVTGILGLGWYSNIGIFFKSFFNIKESWTWAEVVSTALFYSLLLWTCSVFVLGGTWFRKYAFLIVVLSIVALFIAIFKIFPRAELINISDTSTTVNSSAYVVILLLTAFSLFNFWLSYQIFKRFQIITSKWTNV